MSRRTRTAILRLGVVGFPLAVACCFNWALPSPAGVSDAGADASEARADATGLEPAVDGGTSYRDLILQDRPVAYWRLGEAPGDITARDETGNGNDGTYVGSISLGKPGAIAGETNTAVHLSNNGTVRVGDKLDFGGNTAMSIEAWASLEDDVGDPSFVRKEAASLAGYVFTIWSGNLRFDHSDGTSQGYCACIEDDGGARFADHAFHHIVATYDTVTARIYADGIEVATLPCAASLPDSDIPLEFGRLRGILDEVAMYDRVLPEPTIQRHFAAGTRPK